MENKPVILIVNDDGYEAKGLKAMVEIAKAFGEVYVVTPDSPRSGMAHAITIGTPLRLKKYHQEEGVEYWRTNGTPVDCVKLGQRVLLKDRKIDLVLSGINQSIPAQWQAQSKHPSNTLLLESPFSITLQMPISRHLFIMEK